MTDYICLNGAFATVSDIDEPFIYQYIRTCGHHAIHMQRHIEMLDVASLKIRHSTSGLTASQISAEIERLLIHNGYSDSGIHVVLLKSFDNSRYCISCHGTSMYDTLSLRALRPKATIVEVGYPFDNLPTSVVKASTQFISKYVTAHGFGAFVAVNRYGYVTSVNGGTPIIITDGHIIISDSCMTVEAESVIKAFEIDNRPISIRKISRDELSSADELIGVDHRGITSISECDGTAYSDIIINITSGRL